MTWILEKELRRFQEITRPSKIEIEKAIESIRIRSLYVSEPKMGFLKNGTGDYLSYVRNDLVKKTSKYFSYCIFWVVTDPTSLNSTTIKLGIDTSNMHPVVKIGQCSEIDFPVAKMIETIIKQLSEQSEDKSESPAGLVP